jgi:hypothetical protein
MRTLDLAAILLPKEMRGRWLTEWAGELAVLPTRTTRAGFVIHLVVGMPRLARTLRTSTDDAEHAHHIPTRTAGPAIAAGTSVAIVATLTMSWPTAAVVAVHGGRCAKHVDEPGSVPEQCGRAIGADLLQCLSRVCGSAGRGSPPQRQLRLVGSHNSSHCATVGQTNPDAG